MTDRPTYRLGDFPDRLEHWIHYLGWSPPDLEQASGVNRAVVWKWRARRSSPTLDKADKVLETLAVPVHEFFDETPAERLLRRVQEAARNAGARGPKLGSIAGLEPGDFMAAMNQVPRCAVPDDGVSDLEDYLTDKGLDRLVRGKILGPKRYPKMGRHERRGVTVALNLSNLQMTLQQWRFPGKEVELVEAAWREAETR